MSIIKVPVVKGKSLIEIETDSLPTEVYAEALAQGLKVLVNRGTTKITKETYPVEDELKVAAMAKAEEMVANLKAGKIKLTAGKAKAASGAEMTEARRLARNLVKDEMKRQGLKISHVTASDITKAANELIAADPSLLEQAKANLASRSGVKLAIDITSIVHENPELVAKAEAKKAKDKADKPLSAKQAGKTEKHKVPTKPAPQVNPATAINTVQ